jgi:microcystin-dependent protein
MLDIKSLGNPNKIIFGVIVFLVIFAAIYVYQNRKRANANANTTAINKQQQIEGFQQYIVSENDSVAINGGWGAVYMGAKILDKAIMDLITSDENKNRLLAGYVQSSELNPTTVLRDIETVKTGINNINNSTTGILANCQNKINERAGPIDNRISTIEGKLGTIDIQREISRLSTAIDSTTPPLTIVAFYGDQAPEGWQICNGEQLIGMDSVPVVYGNNSPVLTPRLSGRVIVGAGKTNNGMDIPSLQDNINSRGLTMQRVGDYGGEEQHKLTLTEMPAHSHNVRGTVNWDGGNGLDNGSRSSVNGSAFTFNTGGDSTLTQLQDPNDATKKINATASHNIMQPYFVLMYIIKKPKNGGTIIQPFANIATSPIAQAKLTRF